MAYQTIRTLELNRKRVFIRVDFNVPIDHSCGVVTSDARIKASIPTIGLALRKGASVILASHLGRPKGKRDLKLSLAPIALRLAELLGRDVTMAPDCVGVEVKEIISGVTPGDVVLLENLRFYPQEEANESNFANELASFCDCYVNDAFGAIHRTHASTVGMVGSIREIAAGLLIEKELHQLTTKLRAPRRPYVAIVGGAKISSKIDILKSFVDLSDKILIGGAMAYTFLAAKGLPVGDSLVEVDKIDVAHDIMTRAGHKLLLPVDHCIAPGIDRHAEARIVDGVVESIPTGWKGLDIGPRTVETYKSEILRAQTVFWNGPMGVFEVKAFRQGTVEIARIVGKSKATSVVGGGDSERAIRRAGVVDQITHLSTGGGATLQFLAGKQLPGIEVLGGLKCAV